MTLLAIPEEIPFRFAHAREESAKSHSQHIDQVSMNIKHTFIEVVDKPATLQRTRSFTDSELLADEDSRDTRYVHGYAIRHQVAEFSDTSTDAPSSNGEEVIVARKASEWESPYWGPAGDLFYSTSMPSDAFFPLPHAEMPINDGYFWPMMLDDSTWGMQCPVAPNPMFPMEFDKWQSSTGVETALNPTATDSTNDVCFGSVECEDVAVSSALVNNGVVQEREEELKMTVMLRRLPNHFTRSVLIELLEDEGFEGSFDLVYVPMDFGCQCCLGYAIVNFLSASDADRCWRVFAGYSDWEDENESECEVMWSNPYQGVQALIDRYRNSPVMHDSVPEEWKPAYFVEGVQTTFPGPTEKIKAPKLKTTRGKGKKGKH